MRRRSSTAVFDANLAKAGDRHYPNKFSNERWVKEGVLS
jgi:hypothetical protein